jgi:hypothetical protein
MHDIESIDNNLPLPTKIGLIVNPQILHEV